MLSSSGDLVLLDPAPCPVASAGIQWTRDPRLPELGDRMIFPAGYTPPGKIVTPDAFRNFRLRLGVAEGCLEIPTGEALPLEYNLDALNGISYTKGCYVGQELTARTHFRGVIRKRLMPVSFFAPASAAVSGTRRRSPPLACLHLLLHCGIFLTYARTHICFIYVCVCVCI